MKLKDTCSSEEKPWQHTKKQKHCFADKGPSSQSFGFSSSHVWMLSNCGVGEDSWESLGLQGDQTSQS